MPSIHARYWQAKISHLLDFAREGMYYMVGGYAEYNQKQKLMVLVWSIRDKSVIVGLDG